MRPAIVVIAFNRPRSIERLLYSLAAARYEQEDIPLIISVDYDGSGRNLEVREIAEKFSWEHGEKRLLFREKNMGLKSHVLSCGDLSEEYGAVLLLEDDLYVSPCFYSFGVQALSFSEDKEVIGGVSLYNHLFNVHAREPFQALWDGYDNWYFQFASSWGQGFTEGQWRGFKEWLDGLRGRWPEGIDVPANVAGWSEKSWLKFYIAYLIGTDRYFLYPQVSLTTNFFDEGAHSERAQTDFQVPLQYGMNREYLFSTLEESGSVYDAYFENTRLAEYAGVPGEDLTTDLYGYRPCGGRYYLTSRPLPYKIIQSYGLKLRPMDANVTGRIPGSEIFLYDMSRPGRTPAKEKGLRILYHNRGFKAKYMMEIIRTRLKERKK